MTDREDTVDVEVDLDLQRKLFLKQIRSLARFNRAVTAMRDRETTTSVSLVAINEKMTEMATITRRATRAMDLILDAEEDEGRLAEDEKDKIDFQNDVQATKDILHNMSSLKKAAALSQLLDKSIRHVEGILLEGATKDCSAFMPDIQRHLDIFAALLVESTIEQGNEIWGIKDSIQERLLHVKAQMKTATPAPTTTIIKTDHERDFATPKVNIPHFTGGLEAWASFWGRFRPAVHENAKLRTVVKMAILLDLIDDPALKLYLTAQSDGKEGRYEATILYLQNRFDRPRELHQIFCKQLVEIPPIRGTSEELSKTADDLFAAVEGIRRGGQMSIDYVATSLAVSVLPAGLRLQWENKTEEETQVPHVDKLISFLRKKAINASQAQKVVTTSAPQQKEKKRPQGKHTSKVYTSHSEPVQVAEVEYSASKFRGKQAKGQTSNRAQCSVCSANHFIFSCKQFQDMAVPQRREHVLAANLCFNCLKPGHAVKDCHCSYKCRLCRKTHNTLLHLDTEPSSPSVTHVVNTTTGARKGVESSQQHERLLMTSLVNLTTSSGKQIEARAMLDSGAGISVLSKRMMQQLQLKHGEEWVTVSGVESSQNTPVRPTTNITISSIHNPGWSTTVKVVILPKATKDLPEHHLPSIEKMPHLKDLLLADPLFQVPRRVDLILDVDIMEQVLLPEKVTGPEGTPSAWKTKLGWGVMGKCALDLSEPGVGHSVNAVAVQSHDTMQLNRILERLWVIESPPKGTIVLSPQEVAVQQQYDDSHYFSPTAGRYVVTLPRKETALQLGESQHIAQHRFLRNEQALIRKGTWAQFQAVVQEYLTLGHAQEVTPQELCTPVHETYHLPMHAVFKASSTSTKLRVVFDASCPSASGVALNDILAAGPTLHPNLDVILIRFRSYRVAVSSDISKMYREVLLSKKDRQLHRFIWRAQPDEPLKTYCMNRVTFGVTSSPYVAVRTLQQVARDFSEPSSRASYHISHSFYVDDLLAGSDSESEAVELCTELRGVVAKGGFDLRKWRSSATAVLDSIPPKLQELLPTQEFLDSHQASYPKALGIAWDSRLDVMTPLVQLPPEFVSTKRGVVSDTARAFDVLGWMAPFMIRMKVLFQQLWREGLDWDTDLPQHLADLHSQWRSELDVIAKITLPRCYFLPLKAVTQQLHGFSDASERAYAGVVYIRATYGDGTTSSRLVVAKTRVAPLKLISIPRLELCGGVLMSELLATVMATLNIEEESVFAWTDSTVALAWLKGTPCRYKTFVGNRISEAASNIPQNSWHHVPTEQNPADCASRGISAQELQQHPLWWGGPPWLFKNPVQFPTQPALVEETQIQEERAKRVIVNVVNKLQPPAWGQEFTSYTKLLHVTAYVVRFCANLKSAIQGHPLKKEQTLGVCEIQAAEVLLFKWSQHRSYPGEVKRLSAAAPPPISMNSALKLINPILSEDGLILVGGRLENSSLSSRQKHPPVLSSSDWFTKLLFVHYHAALMHCGPTLLLAHTSLLFYAVGARRLAKSVCRSCILCKKKAPRAQSQQMGQLPAARVNQSPIFLNTGVDYAGPFQLKQGNPRRPTVTKCWLALFVCLATKLVHIEVVSAASTEAFIAAFKRFAARKGLARDVYSDHGTNFVGARSELLELYNFLNLPSTDSAISDCLLAKKITWHHIPERAPHFGGIWEAVVKSAKHHLKRIVGPIKLTFEELTTTTCCIEACLNSRPYLAQASHDSEGETPLTPGHFLMGRPVMAYPEAPSDPAMSLRSRWKL